VPPGTQPIDATGQFLILGLWDLHVHTRSEGIDHLRLVLINGVTTARDMVAPWHHLAQITLWQNEIASGERVGPTLLTAGRLLDGPGSPWSHAATVADPAGDRIIVCGYPGLDPGVYRLHMLTLKPLTMEGQTLSSDPVAARTFFDTISPAFGAA
jgi:hypothetical protein